MDVVSVAILEAKQDAPARVDVHRPEIAQIAFELVQSDTVQA